MDRNTNETQTVQLNVNNSINSPLQVLDAYAAAGAGKCTKPAINIFLLAILAGALIALGAAATNTAAHSVASVGIARLICALLFPFGLAMVVLMGAELFTGNCLIAISVLENKATFTGMIKNWIIVYLGNFAGALMIAAACAYTGLLSYSSGGLALFTMKMAAAKCTITFTNGIILGIVCNVLVCLGVLCSMTAKDTTGKILGAFLPVSLFVLCGFEHCIANMFYIPTGLFAKTIPAYLALATENNVNADALTWGNFLIKNLIPVTIGNILGGTGIGILLLRGHKKK